MLELVNLSNCRTDLDLICNDACELASFLRHNALDGLEMMFCAPWDPSVHRKEWIRGVHLQFWPSWLNFWRGDMDELLRQFGTKENIVDIYGGLQRQDWLERYRANIRQAVAAEAGYVVFHVCHNRLSEVYNWNFSATSHEVVTASIELINELVDEIPSDMALLLENLWWPGLTLLDRNLVAQLMEGIRHPRTGIMLDTGHLMNTRSDLRTQEEGIDYILRTLEELGPWREYIRGIHLHYSLSGNYVRRMRQQETAEHTLVETLTHVMAIDRHLPFDTAAVGRILNYVAPSWLVHEFVQKSAGDWEGKVRRQRQALAAGRIK